MSSDAHKNSNSPFTSLNSSPLFGKQDQTMDDLDALKRDRFEILSAYLDGEVTSAERQQVETWLATDPEMQSLHARLLNLQYGLKNLPAPVPEQSAEQTLEQVLARVERKPNLAVILGGIGTAAAAAFIGTITGLLPGNPFNPQLAQRSQPDNIEPVVQQANVEVPPTTLMIALDRPPVEIPRPGVDNSIK